MKLLLVVLSAGKWQGHIITITRPVFVIGRDRACHLHPASDEISRRHCVFRLEGSRIFLRDLNSRNGTFVNDERIQTEVEVRHGDRIVVGPLAFAVGKDTPPVLVKRSVCLQASNLRELELDAADPLEGVGETRSPRDVRSHSEMGA